MAHKLNDQAESALRDFLISEGNIQGELVKLKSTMTAMVGIVAESLRALREKEAFLKAVFDLSRFGIFSIDPETWRITSANIRMTEIFGPSSAEFIGVSFIDLVLPDEVKFISNSLQQLVAGETDLFESEHQFLRQDGNHFWGLLAAKCINSDDGRAPVIIININDDTERRQREEELSKIQKNYWEIFNSTTDALFVHDAYSGAIVDVNSSVEQMYGYSREEILFMSVDELSSGESPYSLNEAVHLIRMAVEEGPQTFEWHCRRKGGEMFWAEVTLTASHIGGEGRVLAVFRDITDRKEIERRLQYLSNHDSLTGLYNRMHFEAEFKRLTKRRKYPLSVIVADLDGLKQINDTDGHESGNELIRLAADTLRKAFRAEDIVARVGGDEFAVLLTDTDEAGVATAIEQIREEEARSNSSRKKFQIRFSLGGATAASAKQTDELFHNADRRMYANKAARKLQPDQ